MILITICPNFLKKNKFGKNDALKRNEKKSLDPNAPKAFPTEQTPVRFGSILVYKPTSKFELEKTWEGALDSLKLSAILTYKKFQKYTLIYHFAYNVKQT